MINAKLMELFSKPHFNDNIHIFVITSPVFVTRTHILLLGLKEEPDRDMTERPKNLWILEPFPFHLFAERSINGSGAAGCRHDGKTPSYRA